MVTYYTALGRMLTKKKDGVQTPIIVIDDTEFEVSVDELILWGSLHWNFSDKELLEKEYSRRKAKNRIFNDTSFEQTLSRLENRGLVVSGTDYLAADALYGLIGKLKIKLIRFSLVDKIRSMAYLYFVKGMPFAECYETYFGVQLTENERNILKLVKNVGITTAEIIQCAENDIKNIKTEDDIIKSLYNDENATFETITVQSRFSDLKSEFVKVVTNLYLKKRIIFEN